MLEESPAIPITRENYREYDAINYSTLSTLDKNPKDVISDEERPLSEGQQYGDLIDIICFDREEKLHEKYYVSTLQKLPTEAIIQIIKTAQHIAKTEDDEDSPKEEIFTDERLLEAARINNYGGKNWKEATILGKIKEDGGEDYMYMLEESKGKSIIGFDTYTVCVKAAAKLKNSPRTEWAFKDAEFQVPLIADISVNDIGSIRFKGLIDSLKENSIENDKYAFVTDLKFTSSRLMSFPYDFVSWKYYLQASLYSDIVEAYKNKPVIFYNIVYSMADDDVMAYKPSSHALQVGRDGGYTKTGRYIKGYKQLAHEFFWHRDTNKWDFPFEVYMNTDGYQREVIDIDPFAKLRDGTLVIS